MWRGEFQASPPRTTSPSRAGGRDMAQLIRVDRNGTKYWYSNKCPRCGGRGYLYGYEHIEGGVCFKCGGTGLGSQSWKEYTPEYKAKLEQKRLQKAIAKAPEANRKLFSRLGFSEDGFAWVVLGDTFSCKDELKAEGARFGAVGWHFDHEPSNRPTVKVSIEQIAEQRQDTTWQLFPDGEIGLIMKEIRNANPLPTASEWVGEVGKRITLEARFVSCRTYTTHYTYRGEEHTILKFKDEHGNTIIWNTSSFYEDLEEGKAYTITGTVKEHSDYRGDKQTVLSRCKVESK